MSISFAFKGYPAKVDRKTALFAGTAKIERVNQYYLGPEEYVVLDYDARTAASDALEPKQEIALATWLYNHKHLNSEVLNRLDRADEERGNG